MKLWLKAGLIGGLIGIFSALIGGLLMLFKFEALASIFLNLMGFTAIAICKENSMTCSWFVIFFSSFIYFFLIGSFIGIIIQIIKKFRK